VEHVGVMEWGRREEGGELQRAERHLMRQLESCPARAREVLDEWAPGPERPMAQLRAFWAALDDAMDQWMLAHPDWECLLELSEDATLTPSDRAVYRGMLERHLKRPPMTASERTERRAHQQKYCDANHRLDADLTPYLDPLAQRACYLIRLTMIERDMAALSAASLVELLTWREAVARHLRTQLEKTDAILNAEHRALHPRGR